VGRVLPLELFSIVGSCFLLFDSHVFDRRLWGSRPSADLEKLGPVEAITGVLMCGLSASFLFAIVTRLVEHVEREERLLPEAVKEPEVRREQ
jgi:hypothetical protein